MLEVTDVVAGYGQFQALFGVSISVADGQAVAVIGANGAGKSTLMKVIAGTLAVRSGTVKVGGVDLAGVPAHDRVYRGISLVPEGRRIFKSLSVMENLTVGGYHRRRGPWTVAKVLETFPLLERLLDRSAARLSGGEQQTLAIARALMNNPSLLLLDEVSLGLAPVVVKQVYAALPAIRAEGTTLLIVEQDVNQALAASDYVYCMLEGTISLAGPPAELSRTMISDAYFGVAHR